MDNDWKEYKKFIEQPWEVKERFSMTDDFSITAVFGTMWQENYGTVLTEFFTYINPDQRVGYYDNVYIGDPNQNVVNMFMPMVIN